MLSPMSNSQVFQESGFLQEFNRDLQKKRATENLAKAKKIVKQREKAGFVWVDHPVYNNCKILVAPEKVEDYKLQRKMNQIIKEQERNAPII